MNKRSISGYLEEDGAGGKSSDSGHVGQLRYDGSFRSMFLFECHTQGCQRWIMQTHALEQGTSRSCPFQSLLHQILWLTIGSQKYALQLPMMLPLSTAVALHTRSQVARLTAPFAREICPMGDYVTRASAWIRTPPGQCGHCLATACPAWQHPRRGLRRNGWNNMAVYC